MVFTKNNIITIEIINNSNYIILNKIENDILSNEILWNVFYEMIFYEMKILWNDILPKNYCISNWKYN